MGVERMGGFGVFVTFALVASLVAASGPAWAAEIPTPPPVGTPGLPPFPAPPATLGRCIVVAQDFINVWTGFGDQLRAQSLSAVTRDQALAASVVTNSTDSLMPQGNGISEVYVALVGAAGDVAIGLAAVPVQMAQAASPATNESLRGISAGALDAFPHLVQQAIASAPWSWARANGSINPVLAWNNDTEAGELLALPAHLTFLGTYASGVINGPAPPLGHSYAALEAMDRGFDRATTGAAPLAAAPSDGVDATARAAGDAARSVQGLPSAGLPDPMGTKRVLEAGLGGLTTATQRDAAALQGTVSANRVHLLSRTMSLPSLVIGCPNM